MKDEASLSSSLSRSRERAGVRARALRQSATDAEALLWFRLRNRQLLDLKFRRQRPIGRYFADVACVEIGLVIELDGSQHLDQIAYDRQREADMKALGFTTLRLWDNEVLKETDAVMEKIWQVAQTLITPKTLTPTLSRKREREQERKRSLA
jgi:very-short-patch-repair endonuclease